MCDMAPPAPQGIRFGVMVRLLVLPGLFAWERIAASAAFGTVMDTEVCRPWNIEEPYRTLVEQVTTEFWWRRPTSAANYGEMGKNVWWED